MIIEAILSVFIFFTSFVINLLPSFSLSVGSFDNSIASSLFEFILYFIPGSVWILVFSTVSFWLTAFISWGVVVFILKKFSLG